MYDLATRIPKNRYAVAVATGGNGPLIARLDSAQVRTFVLPSLERDINFMKEVQSLFELFQLVRTTKPDVLHVNSSKPVGLAHSLAGSSESTKSFLLLMDGRLRKFARGGKQYLSSSSLGSPLFLQIQLLLCLMMIIETASGCPLCKRRLCGYILV